MSIYSLHISRDLRTTYRQFANDTQEVPAEDHIMGNLFRKIADPLELQAAEVAEPRTRLRITERADSTLEKERQRLLKEP